VFAAPLVAGDGERVRRRPGRADPVPQGGDGALRWSYNVKADVDGGPAMGEDGNLYVGADDGRLYALRSDGSLRWSFVAQKDIRAAAAVAASGAVYVGSFDGNLYALAPTGDVKWVLPTGGRIAASPVIDAAGTIYVGSQDDHLYAVSPKGRVLWTFELPGDVDSSVAISDSGVVVVGCDDGHSAGAPLRHGRAFARLRGRVTVGMVCAVKRAEAWRRRAERGEKSERQRRAVAAKLMVNPAGFGFAEPLDGGDSVYIPRGRLGVALDGDEVTIRFWASDKGYEGEIVELVRRGRTRLTGVPRLYGAHLGARARRPAGAVAPELVGTGEPVRPRTMVVVAAITHYPTEPRDAMLVQVERVLGPPDTLATEQLKILIERGINPEFPEAVLAEAQGVPSRSSRRSSRGATTCAPRVHDDRPGRRPRLRRRGVRRAARETTRTPRHATCTSRSPMCRTTSARARRSTRGGAALLLGVPAGPGDPDAAARAQLAHVLAGAGRGSPGDGRQHAPRRRRRGERGPAAGGGDPQPQAPELRAGRGGARGRGQADSAPEIERIKLLRRAADRLRVMRLHRGAVELNLPETKIMLDQDDPSRIRDIVPSRASKSVARAYNLIEELMLAANEAVGQIAVTYKLPMVFRVHDLPDADKLELLAAAAEVLGMEVDPEKLRTPRGVQKFLSRAETHAARSGAAHVHAAGDGAGELQHR
jgi:hypothetical protein